MTHLYAYSCHKWSAYISYEYEWQQLHNIFSEHKNNLNLYWCIELTIKLWVKDFADLCDCIKDLNGS